MSKAPYGLRIIKKKSFSGIIAQIFQIFPDC